MAIENLFVRNPIFITNGKVKREALTFGDFPYLSNPSLLEAVAQGEKRVDEMNKVGLFTELSYYPLSVALSKALSVQKVLKGLNGGLKDNTYAVFDATWATPNEGDGKNIYINKPSSHPQGSVAGAKAISEFFSENPGREVSNVAATVIFTPEKIFGIYEMIIKIGKIAKLNDSQRRQLRNIAYENRHVTSAGLNILTAWDSGFVEKPKNVELAVNQHQIFENGMQQFKEIRRIYLPFLIDWYKARLDYNPQLNNLFLGWALGILPKGLVFPIDT